MCRKSAALLSFFLAFNDKCLLFIAAIIREDSLITRLTFHHFSAMLAQNVWPQLLFWALRLQLAAVAHICRQKTDKWNADQPVQRGFLKYRDYCSSLQVCSLCKSWLWSLKHLKIGCRQYGDDFRKAALVFFSALHKIKNHDHLFANHEISVLAVANQPSSLMSFLLLPEWIQPSCFPRHTSVLTPLEAPGRPRSYSHDQMTTYELATWWVKRQRWVKIRRFHISAVSDQYRSVRWPDIQVGDDKVWTRVETEGELLEDTK